MTTISPRLTYNDFFEDQISINHLLKGFTKNDLFRISSLLNSKVKQNQSSTDTVSDWISSIETKNAIIQEIETNNLHIINTFSYLTLLFYIIYCHDTKASMISVDFELKLFKIYLLNNTQQDLIENKTLLNH